MEQLKHLESHEDHFLESPTRKDVYGDDRDDLTTIREEPEM